MSIACRVMSNDGGYVLMTMLVLLLGVGGGWMSVSGSATLDGAYKGWVSTKDRQNLVDARQALLSYGALYPFMYGPMGAGPAHMPCPDTDAYTINAGTGVSGYDHRRDGPNPPCASLSGSQGKLPRHIVLPGHRYLFHADAHQRYGYAVAGDMVNNPVNRVVNVSALQARGRQPVASISVSSSRLATSEARVVITGRALVDATAAAVAAWVIGRTHKSQRALFCANQPQGSVEVRKGLSARSDNTCTVFSDVPGGCESHGLMSYLLDYPIVVDGQCVEDSLALNTIEGVPALRHWFIRNQWDASVVLSGDARCAERKSERMTCELVYSMQARKAAPVSGLVRLEWTEIL